jgi:hypothetical protein
VIAVVSTRWTCRRGQLRKGVIMSDQDCKQYIGMEKDAAIKAIEDDGCIARVVEEDGEPQFGTCEFRDNRVNLSISCGFVTGADRG